MAPRLSSKTAFLKQSDIRRMTLLSQKHDAINLSQGVCDTPIPDAVKTAAKHAIDHGPNTYTRADGIPELRRAVAKKLDQQNGLLYDPESEIVITNGSTGALYGAAMAVLEPGDEVLLFEPYYGYHKNTLLALGCVPVPVPLAGRDFGLDIERTQAAVSPRTRGVLINTPANPSGKVFTEAELRALAELAEQHDLWVFTDEIYEHFVYDQHRHLSPARLPELRERTITINGFSKTFSITGWRIGFCAAPAALAQRISQLSDLVYICAPAPLQAAVAAGLDALGPEFYSELQANYTHKRQRICTALGRAGLTPIEPKGAYYVLAEIGHLPGRDCREKTIGLLERTRVAAVPGSAFYDGSGGEHLARFCFAKDDDTLDEACRRLETLSEG